jgi:hypothetical protein
MRHGSNDKNDRLVIWNERDWTDNFLCFEAHADLLAASWQVI